MDLNYQFRWQQLAHRLVEDLVHSPDLTLPGTRVLGQKYKVSRITVEHTLSHLEELGIIKPAQPGKKRLVNLSKLRKISSLQGRMENRILYITMYPEKNPPYIVRKIYETIHELCERDGFSLDYVELPAKEEELRALLISIEPLGVIIGTIPKAFTEVVVALNIPAVGLGIDFPKIPCFYMSYPALLAPAFRQAWKAGHRRIAAPVLDLPEPHYGRMADILKKLFEKEGVPFSSSYNLPSFRGETAQDFHAGLRELFRYTPPTCIILFDVSHYLAVSSFFLQKGLRIPNDISVILLSQDDLLEDIIPSVAHFILYPEEVTRQVYLILHEQMKGLQSQEQAELTPVWVPGNSLAAPK